MLGPFLGKAAWTCRKFSHVQSPSPVLSHGWLSLPHSSVLNPEFWTVLRLWSPTQHSSYCSDSAFLTCSVLWHYSSNSLQAIKFLLFTGFRYLFDFCLLLWVVCPSPDSCCFFCSDLQPFFQWPVILWGLNRTSVNFVTSLIRNVNSILLNH